MQFKDYQTDVLETLGTYLRVLAAKRDEAAEYVEFQRARGREVEAGRLLPRHLGRLARREGLAAWPATRPAIRSSLLTCRGRTAWAAPVPNICLKLPTGGGKTLLGLRPPSSGSTRSTSIRKRGSCCGSCPSESIYAQTWRAFANREHWYRQMLERASGGRVKLLETGRRLHPPGRGAPPLRDAAHVAGLGPQRPRNN